MTGKPAATQCNHPVYPHYEQQHGEDPARILHHDLDPRPRIRGLKTTEIVRAYLDVETNRNNPREKIVAALNRRLDYLQGLNRAHDALEDVDTGFDGGASA